MRPAMTTVAVRATSDRRALEECAINDRRRCRNLGGRGTGGGVFGVEVIRQDIAKPQNAG